MNGELALKRFSTLSASVGGKMKTAGDALSKVLFFSLADESILPQKRVCISIERGLFSYAAGTRFLGRTTVRSAKIYPTGDDTYPSPEKLAATIAFDLPGRGGSSSPVTLAIPKAWTIIKTVDFPLAVKENISEVVSFELDRVTPLNPSDTFFDYRIVKETSEQITVMVMAARVEAIAPYIEALKDHRITVDRLMCSLEGAFCLLPPKELRRDLILVDVNDRFYEGAVFRNTYVTGTFTGDLSTADENEKAVTITDAIHRQRDLLGTQGASPETVLLLRRQNARLRTLLTSRTSFIPRIIDYSAAEDAAQKGEERPASFAIAGLMESLLSRRQSMNLLSRGIRSRSRRPLAVTALLSALLLGMVVVYGVIPLQIEERRIRGIDAEIAQRKEEVKKVEVLKKEIEAVETEIGAIRDFRERRPLTLALIKELTSVIPKNAWLTRIKIGEKTVEIEGYSSNATELLGKLESSAYFEKVEFASPTFRDARQNADKFSIRMTLEETDDDA